MKTQLRKTALSMAAVIVFAPAHANPPDTSPAEPLRRAPSVTLHNATPELTARVEWAIDRFSDAGLHLPPLDITFHDHSSGCDGYKGLFLRIGEVGHIDVCTVTRHIILHELAHAWESLGSEIDARPDFLDYWDLSVWDDRTVSWEERGSEKAANTIALALNDIPSEPADALLQHLCSYELLTGNPLPHLDDGHGKKWCEPTAP